jgi:Tol biopolymer transport system component
MKKTLAIAGAVLGAVCLVTIVQAQVVRQLTDYRAPGFNGAAIDDAATVVFTVSTTDQFGTNPENSIQLLEWSFPGPVGSQAGTFADGVADVPVSVTDDGTQVVFVSPSDPVGENHDGSLELFLMTSDGSSVVQITHAPLPGAGSVREGAISGSGNRVAFIANTDPLGINPGHAEQVFVADPSTLDLTQLTNSTGGEFADLTISDFGALVAFAHDGDLVGDNPDGSTEVFVIFVDSGIVKQVTDSPTDSSTDPVISGGGTQIAFNGPGGVYLVTPGGAPVLLVEGEDPTITDDAAFVYYGADGLPDGSREIWEIPAAGGASTMLTSSTDGIGNGLPVVSGDGGRVVFRSSGGEYPGGNNPDGGGELVIMDSDGSDIEQLTVTDPGSGGVFLWEPLITEDGSRVVFIQPWDLCRIQADGSDFFCLATEGIVENPSVTGDGSTMAFESDGDPTGQNPDNQRQIFQVQDDGSGLIQLTPGECDAVQPAIAANGGLVVFQALSCDLDGQNADGSPELYAVPAGGGPFTQVTDDDDYSYKLPQISNDGQWVAYQSGGNHDGLNPDESIEVLRARTDGTWVERVTSSEYGASSPDISGDGGLVVYASRDDPLGTNPDHNLEVFVYEAETTTTRQLTVTSSGDSHVPAISGDGAYVYFLSTAPFFEELADEQDDVYRVALGTGVVERAGGLRDPRSDFNPGSWRVRGPLAVGGDGSRAVFEGRANPVDRNHDLNKTDEIWLVDFSTPAKVHPSKATPTVVTWDVEPSPVRYDVIRGDVAGLQAGPAGTVDLGPVACLEDDSPDATTLGFEDPDEPVPGQAFFFLYRGSQGIDDGPGTWGQGSGDAERVAGAGSCDP